MTVSGYRVTFHSDENVLASGDGLLCEYAKNH